MLGTRSDSYRYWISEQKRYESIPNSLDFANLGSTCDANNYDYSYWNGIGFNFASVPQDMYYDNQLLEQYGSRVKKGGYVFISISEFAFLTDRYDTDYHNHKYYGFLNPQHVWGYTKLKAFLLKHSPGLVDSRYTKQEVKQLINSLLRKKSPANRTLEEQSIQSMSNWKNEFGWNDEAKLSDAQKETIDRSWNIFLNDISFCKQNDLIPIVVVPSFCEHLKKLMPDHILKECLWRYIERIREMGIQVVDFWNDNELCDEKYYKTPICLNQLGIKLFNTKLQQAVFQERNNSVDMSEKKSLNTVILNNGLVIPSVAFGTGVIKRFYRNKTLYYKDTLKAILKTVKHRKMVRFWKNDLTIKKTLDQAVACGFRLFDTGRLYGHSEKYIGDILSRYSRKDFFIVTKVSDVDLTRYPDKNTIHDNLSQSLGFLRTDYVDAYLLHFPSGDWISMYKDIEAEYKAGRTKSIGVCNFDTEELKKLKDIADVKPMICQVEVHPLNTKKELVDFCKENNILVMAHTPTGHMSKEIVESEVFKKLTKKYKKSAAQIIYRWHIQNGIIPIMTSTSKQHLIENYEVFDFELSAEDMKDIDMLDRGLSFDKNNNKVNDCPQFIYNL